jgi:hypothetical protein
MPSMSGWALQANLDIEEQESAAHCFYALDVGLGFASIEHRQFMKYVHGFYALDVGLGFAS